jgi:hypothetical protein
MLGLCIDEQRKSDHWMLKRAFQLNDHSNEIENEGYRLNNEVENIS